GIVAEAFAAVRRSPLAIFAASALAVVPAHLLANAVDYVGTRQIGAQTVPTRAEQVASRRAELADRPGPAPEANAAEQRDALQSAARSPSPVPFRLRFGRGIAQAIAVGILFAGLLFAQAALVPLAFG